MARSYNNYQYGTNPRKIQPEYEPNRKKQKIKNKNKIKTTQKQKNNSKKVAKSKKSQIKVVFYIGILFGALLVVSYRNSQITERFSEVRNMKNDLAKIQKENEQLEASIESSINLKTIQQQAEELLGMQKLDANQKVYISLPKKDYVEPTTEDVNVSENKNWLKNIIDSILGK